MFSLPCFVKVSGQSAELSCFDSSLSSLRQKQAGSLDSACITSLAHFTVFLCVSPREPRWMRSAPARFYHNNGLSLRIHAGWNVSCQPPPLDSDNTGDNQHSVRPSVPAAALWDTADGHTVAARQTPRTSRSLSLWKVSSHGCFLEESPLTVLTFLEVNQKTKTQSSKPACEYQEYLTIQQNNILVIWRFMTIH